MNNAVKYGGLGLLILLAIGAFMSTQEAQAAEGEGDTTLPPVVPGAGAAVSKIRSVRNNNPGNIIYNSRNKWQGQTGSDGTYAIFDTKLNGARAMLLLLRTYYTKYKLTTISGVIRKWAPASENPTQNYINWVSTRAEMLPDETFPWTKEAVCTVAWMMAAFEAGTAEAFDLYLFEAAWDKYLG